MKNRFLSLLCVLALCLGLLPVTALAVDTAPQTLYVGSTTITTGYWTSSDGGTNWTSPQEELTGDSYIHYNGQGTLELHNATIQGGSNAVSAPFGSGIYAQGSSNQPVALTIELIGENTITGTFGIYVNATPPTTPGTDASLVIKKSGDNGSLTVTGTDSYGLHIASGTGNASLTIKNASVDAKTTQTSSSYAGVCVQSGASATGSPQLSLAVNGGSLTASASEGNDGIQFYVGNSSASATTSLSVTDHAIVDARNGGIKASDSNLNDLSDQIVVGSGTGTSGGIVFDGSTGTVYGSVTLQDDLEIKSGETLTVPSGAELNCNGKLTNNGTILASGGNLTGNLSGGTAVTTPSITAQPTGQTVTEGTQATFSVTASDAQTYQWQQKTADSGSDWTDINSATEASYTISSTTTSMSDNQYRCVVTGSGGVSVISSAATLTVTKKSVTGVTLSQTELTLYTGGTGTLTATVQPDDATNKNVTWQSNNANVATVEGGTVTAVGVGETTISVTTEDGGKTATCKVTVTQSAYSISADTTALNFGSVYTGYAQPAAKEVTITNTGNRPLTLNQPASTSSFEVGTLTDTELAAGEKATFTVQPKAGLAVGAYSENITISGTHDVNATISATFTVKQYSSGGGTPTKTPSQQAEDKIEAAKDGSTVEIKLSTGSTKLDKEVFEALAGRDVTLEISLPGGVSWTVNGQDIPENTDLTDLDLGVTLDASTIPVSVINTVTGAVDTIQLSLKHDGEFGFTMILSAPLGETNAGYWANLYYYNTRTRALEFQSASKIATDGTASFPFSHASDYAIVIDTDSHEPVELPFTDVPEGAWYEDAAAYVYKHGLMAGTSATTFAPEVTTSRAMIATILWRMAGSPVVNYAMNYTDVTQCQWCSEAIRWATSEGVVTGYGNGLFGTNDPITREQLATMLWRYAQTEDYDVSVGEDTNILSYTDALEISEYAIPAMQWACGAGIIQGNGGYLDPQGDATRAEIATMLMRFCVNVAKD